LACLLGVAACGSDDDAASEDGAAETTIENGAESTEAPDDVGSEAVATAEDVVAEYTEWPTELPSSELGEFTPPESGLIYHIACDLSLEGCANKADGMKAAADALGLEFEVCDGGATADTIAQCFTNAINADPDVIIPNGIGVDAAGDGYAEAESRGIPIVGSFTGNDFGVPGVATEVGGDVCGRQGEVLAASVIADSQGEANVLFLETQTYKCNQQRVEGFMSAMEACDTCQAESLVFSITAIQTDLPGQVTAELTANPDLTHIVGTFDGPALVAADAVRQAGLEDQIRVAGFDANPPNLELIRNGDVQFADIASGQSESAWAAVDAAARVIAGEELPENIGVTLLLINEGNVDQIDGTYEGPEGYEDLFRALWGVS
jgi:ribose transport system substrate-binding protein